MPFVEVEDDCCYIRNWGAENTQHLLLKCLPMKAVWWNSGWQIHLQAFSSWQSLNWIEEILNPNNSFPLDLEEKEELVHFIAIAFELLWMERNNIRVGNSATCWEVICCNVNRTSANYCKVARSRHSHVQRHPIHSSWSPPLVGQLKMNFDTAFWQDQATAACILRDYRGEFLGAWTRNFRALSAFEAEAKAAIQALKKAKSLMISELILEEDAFNIISMLKGDMQNVSWRFHYLIAEGRLILSIHSNGSVMFVHRSANSSAHHLALWACLNHFEGFVDPQALPHAVLL